MRTIASHWIEKAPEATAALGLFIPGCDRPTDHGPEACPDCQEPLRLAAVYRKSPLIPFDRFEAFVLQVCWPCSRETDGYEGRNGYFPRLVTSAQLEEKLRSMPCLLSEAMFFRALPTDEPKEKKAFDEWSSDKVRAK